MKKIFIPVIVCSTFLLSGYTALVSTKWDIKENYNIKFSSANPSGVFSSLKGEIMFDETNLQDSKFDIIIDAASINTGNGMKNRHAKSAKWFDAERYPSIRFVSSKVYKKGDGYEVTGVCDMHGVKKEIVIPFTFSNNTFSGSFEVNRLDYGIGTTEGSSGKAATILKVNISVPVIRN